jgi:hypothetical protein
MADKITKTQLVDILDKILFEWEYKDIERASIYGEAKLAGFILGACFIDAMAGFYTGLKRENSKKGSGTRFKEFARKYLLKYDAEKLYGDLRCDLVHSYTEGGTYIFTDAKPDLHLKLTPKGKIVLNLEDYLVDLKLAYLGLRNDILHDENIFIKAKQRYLSMHLMGPVVLGKS